ncbi:MAG: hypothetical protein ACOX6Q_03910 [Candidatus Dojkabacteria bacterium]|jgi:hypothetical protein
MLDLKTLLQAMLIYKAWPIIKVIIIGIVVAILLGGGTIIEKAIRKMKRRRQK